AAQLGPELLLVAHDEDEAVPGAVELARGERGVARARLAALVDAGVEVPHREVAEVLQGGVEQVDVDVAALARRARGEHAGDEGEGGGLAGHQIDDGKPAAARWPVGLAGERQV